MGGNFRNKKIINIYKKTTTMGCGCKQRGNNVQPNQNNNVKIKISENTQQSNVPLTSKQEQQVDIILNRIKELKTKS